MKKIIIVNYGLGNVNSVFRKISRLGIHSEISDNPTSILKADKIILPGVGHFRKAVENLQISGIWHALNEAVLVKKTPVLGICLGMQLMTKNSEEGDVEGFGWFNARVVRFRVQDTLKHKVPHMGWNSIKPMKSSKLMNDLPETPGFYFVHSYHAVAEKPDEVLATSV